MRGDAMVVAMLLLGGCVSKVDDGQPQDTPATPPSAHRGFGPEPKMTGVPAPDLEVGRAWTYEGFEFYNDDASFTVVVASVESDGYLFAGGAEDDLVYEALWSSRWYNKHDLDLGRAGWDQPLVRFPLHDGATWEYSDGLQLTARRATVDTPLGRDERGFVIEGADARVSLRVEYSPLAQNVVRLLAVGADGVPRHDLRMTRVADGQPWVWYELGPLAVAPGAHEPAVFDVPEGFDHVIASAGGTTGARARLDGPGAASWSAEFTGEETWRHAMLPATPGTWIGTVAGRPFLDAAPETPIDAPVGWAYMHVAPVRWLRG